MKRLDRTAVLVVAADHQNSPLSITEIPQGSERRGGLDLSLRGCQGATS
jgi:hypothetical protein